MKTTFEVRTISLAEIIEPDGYQRTIDLAVVARIHNGYDAAQWDLPKAAEVDGGYRIIAGQHRVAVARLFLAENDWRLPGPAGFLDVQVITGLDGVAEEAELFLNDAGNKKAIAPFYKHRAGVIACRQDSLDIERALRRYKVNLVTRYDKGEMVGTAFVSVQTLYTMYHRARRAGVDQAMVIDDTLALRSLWSSDDEQRSNGSIVGALAIVVMELYQSDGDSHRLAKVVRSITATKVAKGALSLALDHPGMSLSQPLTYAEVLRDRVNRLPVPKRKATPTEEPFVSRFPVAVEVGAI